MSDHFGIISQALSRFCIQLRLKFVLILVPIFLWGAFVADAELDGQFGKAFVLFHLCLYGGVNALNTYYDRDEGPIGGLIRPPEVDRSLFYLAWGIQLLGFALSMTLPFGFCLIYLTAMGMSVAYSHPRIRLKGHPIGSALIVGIGQGWLTYWAGWIASGVQVLAVFTLRGILGGLAVTIMTVAMYPLTQIYQIESDRAKGDRTLAVWLGTQRSFLFARLGVGLAGICMSTLFWLNFRRLEVLGLVGYFVSLSMAVYLWSRNHQSMRQIDNYRTVMRLNIVNSCCFLVYLLLHFWDYI